MLQIKRVKGNEDIMVIEEYNIIWPIFFEKIKSEILENVKTPCKIIHIGSTSIPGMYAKPIIDINIEIEDIVEFSIIKDELEKIGYIHEGNLGIEGREAFKRGSNIDNEVLDNIWHHLYVCEKGSREHVRNIQFRDYLRKHKEYVDRYNEIKKDILREYGEDNRKKYVEIKNEKYKWFIEEVIEKSNKETTG